MNMDRQKKLQAAEQFLKSGANIDNVIQRRSANYKPNIWKYDFIQSLTSKYDGEGHKRLADKLKEDVKQMFVELKNQLAKLELVDSIKKLGLAYLFEEEIDKALDTIASASKSIINPSAEEDLYAIALSFRLLRQNRYEVSQDMFSSFIDENGTFVKSKCIDIKGLMELYEASHLGLEGENIVDEAKAFATETLKEMISCTTLDGDVAKQVARALELSSHQRVPWFNVKWYINMYEKSNHTNTTLLLLAKLNFNMVQATLQKDLREISRWWRNLGLIKDLNFTRDRLVESFLCTVGLVFEPQHRSFRKWLTKVIILILIIDDVYDVYGSLNELKQFTDAIDRWESKEIEQLPECMKICFQALYDIVNEIAYEIHEAKGWDLQVILPHLKKVWADFCKSLFVEAKWYNERYTPSLQEYLSNAWISSSGPVISIHSFLSITNEFTEQLIEFLDKKQDIVYNQSLIIRLCNDLGTTMAERERGDAPSSILCYQQEVNVSDEKAEEHVKRMINKTWKKMNSQCSTKSSNLLQSFVTVATNAARVAHSLYQYEDGFGVQDRETRTQIISLLVEPLEL